MEENNIKTEEPTGQSKEEIKKVTRGLIENLKKYLKELLDFRDDTDHEATINAIKTDIPFKGATAWILIFAVFVASIGLNADSTAVVIGAMLISPLMGPILGIGSAFAINDINIFKKSAVSLATMIVLSLLASFSFFYFFPLSEDTSELLGRTKPDIRDVLIAFFGGLALMVARTKKGTVASVIFGVAIATALMPPLCTAGYGLAKGFSGDPIGFKYALGAMYLFTINTIFIALATFLVLKLLSFPMHKYANAAKRKRYATVATVVGIAVMIPAVYTFIHALEESRVNAQLKAYIINEIETIDNFQLIENEYESDTKILKLNFFNEVTEAEKNMLENRLINDPRYDRLKEIKIDIKGSDTKSFELITTAYKEKVQELKESKSTITTLESQIKDLQNTIVFLNNRIEQDAHNNNKKAVAFSRIAKDAKIRYNDIRELGFANVLVSKDFIKIDTVPQVIVKWNYSVPDSISKIKEKELKSWLEKEMSIESLLIKNN